MNIKEIVSGFAVTGPIVFVVNLIVEYLYSLLAHGAGVLDWEMSIRLAIILGIALPIIRALDKKKA